MRTLTRPRKPGGCGDWRPAAERGPASCAGPAREEPVDFAKCGLLPDDEQVAEPDVDGSADEPALAEAGPPPYKGGAATIVCDGKGGYRVALNGWAGAACGTEECVRRHEQSHANDWKKRWPEGCKGKRDGDRIPLGGDGYAAFLKTSECTAHTVDLASARKLLAAKKKAKDTACVKTVQDYITLTEKQKKNYC